MCYTLSEGYALPKKATRRFSMSTQYSCDTCSNFRYDEDYEEYVCMAGGMDEDDYSRLMSGAARECPYYHFDNEYDIVKKQM